MKKPIYITGLSLFLAVCMAINVVVAGSGRNTINSAEIPSAKNSAVKTLTYDFETEGYNNSLDKLLDEDGFIYGIDYNYCGTNTDQYASLGTNHILDDKSPSWNAFIAETDIYNMKALGFNAIGWWLLGHCEGVQFDEDGYAIGVDDEFLSNLRQLLDICRKYDMKIVPLLQTHGTANNYNNGSSTETATEILHKYFKFQWDDTARQYYLDNVIAPVCQVLSEYQDIVIIVSLLVENASNLVQDADAGYSRGSNGTTWEEWVEFTNALNAVSKEYMPNVPTTIEEAGPADDQSGTQENLYRQKDLDTDFISHNFYTSNGGVMSHSAAYATKPGIIGEYNGGGPGEGEASEYWKEIKTRFMKTAKAGGWLGAFLFSYKAGGYDYQMMSGGTTEYDTFHGWATYFYYAIADEINAHRGETRGEVEASVLFANKGGNEVYWLPGRGTSYHTLQRSDDGGKNWKTIAENIDGDEYSTDNGFVKYTDNTLTEGTNFCYRVVSSDDEGNSITSEPNNSMDYFVPENIFTNGGFEDSTTGWVNANSGGGGIVSDEDAYSGSYSLKIDKDNGIGGMSYGAAYQMIEVKPNTTYKLTFKYKVTEAASGDGSSPYVQVLNPETNDNLCYASYYGSAVTDVEVNNGWKSGSLQFSTSSLTSVKIRAVTGSKPVFAAYLDDFELKELR